MKKDRALRNAIIIMLTIVNADSAVHVELIGNGRLCHVHTESS